LAVTENYDVIVVGYPRRVNSHETQTVSSLVTVKADWVVLLILFPGHHLDEYLEVTENYVVIFVGRPRRQSRVNSRETQTA